MNQPPWNLKRKKDLIITIFVENILIIHHLYTSLPSTRKP